MQFQPESNQRKWLKKRGKEHCIDFSDSALRDLRTCFNSLDDDGSEAPQNSLAKQSEATLEAMASS